MPPLAAAAIAALLGLLGLLGLAKKAQGGVQPAPGVAPGTGAARWPYSDLIARYAARYGVEPELVAAHAKVESNFNPNAINAEDPALDYDSSYGLLQVQLAVAQDFGAVNDYRSATGAEVAWLMVPENNIKVGTWNIERWQSRYEWDTAVQMYNVGERGYLNGRRNSDYLRKVREAYNGYSTR
jgi:soluble lytic murein transglycosylase-like protein